MKFTWTDEARSFAVEEYRNRINEYPEEERPAVSQDIAAAIAEELGCSLNSARSIILKAKNDDGTSVYVSKQSGAKSGGKAKANGEGAKRRTKADSFADLVAAITATAGEEAVDMELIEKLTGKAADYFTSVLLAGTETDSE